MSMLIRPDMTVADEIDWAAEAARIRAKREAPKKGSPERSVQVTLKRYMEQTIPGCIVAAVKNEHQARSDDKLAIARFHSKRKAEGVRKGFPDLIVLLPEGRIVLVEVKAARGSLNANQRELHPLIRGLGHVVIVARSIDDLRTGLRMAGVQTREAA